MNSVKAKRCCSIMMQKPESTSCVGPENGKVKISRDILSTVALSKVLLRITEGSVILGFPV